MDLRKGAQSTIINPTHDGRTSFRRCRANPSKIKNHQPALINPTTESLAL
jgi:hypothetical protein